MTRAEYIADVVKNIGSTYSNALPVKEPLLALAGKAFDGVNPAVTILTDSATLTEDQSGGVFGIGTDEKVITLPATKSGLKYTIINTGAAGNNIVTISPQAADGISGTITLAASVVVDAGVVNKDLINTKASACAGDNVTLIGTGVAGVTAWIILSSTGIWAAQG
jgi:hypothetical protein